MLLQLFHSPATPSTLFLNNVTSRPPPYRNYCTLLLGAEGLWDCGADLQLSFRVSDCEVWSWAVRPPQGKYPLASSFSFSDAFLGSRYDMYYSAPPTPVPSGTIPPPCSGSATSAVECSRAGWNAGKASITIPSPPVSCTDTSGTSPCRLHMGAAPIVAETHSGVVHGPIGAVLVSLIYVCLPFNADVFHSRTGVRSPPATPPTWETA